MGQWPVAKWRPFSSTPSANPNSPWLAAPAALVGGEPRNLQPYERSSTGEVEEMRSRGDGVESTMRGICENLRAALCIPGAGGNRRPPPTLSPPDPGGERREDLISALPDDVLLSVLLRLPSAAAAARTSVLSRRWRRLWARLPELWFPHPADPLALARSRAALAAGPPALRLLRVVAYDADPGDAAEVLRLAAARLTRAVFIRNVVPECRKKAVVARAGARAAVGLPCFDRTEQLILCLGYLRLVMPLSGAFAKLTVLHLANVRFQGACDLGDVLSTARCASLRKLVLHDAQGLSNLAICSESLLSVDLCNLEGLQQLTVVAPMLRELFIVNCFFMRQPVADISAPVLENLRWSDVYDPRSVQLGELAQLRILVTCCFAGYGLFEYMKNCGTVLLLQHFQKIAFLGMLIYPINMVNYQYLMEATALLPDIENLNLCLVRCEHVIGTCVFHMLKISTSIRRLDLDIHEGIKIVISHL
ncbi:hypothetical protein GQ55_2G056200 [Panicum hallii var. hallii]|uniref:F-box domain-containing protein n=1 Tax=Panicum hallii var. hallii TaxID=1504633 RepID=A0A2T7ELS7_9POAL|nr:hypothetical protein GQ55_2G056200 [Panicum hallii var. hallii]